MHVIPQSLYEISTAFLPSGTPYQQINMETFLALKFMHLTKHILKLLTLSYR